MTSIEWLVEKIIRKHPIITQFLPNYNFDKEIIEQAKEMREQEIRDACGMALSKLLYQQAIEKQALDELHKQQIIDAYEEGQKSTANGFYIKSGEIYYNNLKK